ncbi:MAG: hypothetical protein LBU11_07685 [Zoogloeaceae bacterium]|nr:hypothetical protein [Zoogloeaceae bacterium]
MTGDDMMTRISFLRYGLRCGAFFLGLAAAALAQAAEVGKVVQLAPDATVSRDGKNQALRQGVAVRDTDVIATNATGRVRILFNDKTALSFGGNTRVNLRDFAGAQKTAFSARLLQSAANSASNAIREQNPRGFGGVRPTATAGKTGIEGHPNSSANLVNVKGSIGAGLGYAFEFRVNLAKGLIFQGKLSDGEQNSGKAYRPDFSEGEGEIDGSGWRAHFTSGSVLARDAAGVVKHENWKITLSGSDSLGALQNLSARGGEVHVTGFALLDEKGAPVLEYTLKGGAQASSGSSVGGSSANGPPKFY